MRITRRSSKRTQGGHDPSGDWTPGTERLVVGALVAAALAVRYYAVSFHPLVAWDGAYYINYFRDASWKWVFPPGYPLVIEFFRFFISDAVLSAQIVSVLFGGLLVVPLYVLARHFGGSKVALVATVLAVFNPLMIRYGAMAMSESQFIFFSVAAFACYVRRYHVLFGIASGIAYLTRPEALLFFVLLLGYDLVKVRDLRFAGLSLAGVLLFIAPYVISLRVETGEWSLSPKSENLRVWDVDWRANLAKEGSPSSVQVPTSELVLASVSSYPDRLAAHAENLLTFAGIPLLLAAAYGIAKHRNILYAGMAMFIVLPLFGLNPFSRFILPYVPFLALFAALALGHIRKTEFMYLGGLVCLLGFAPVVSEIKKQDDDMIELKSAAITIRPQVAATDIFLDRKPYTAFYAGGRYTQIPNEPVDTILAFAARVQARFLVLGERVVYVFRPQLKPLLYGSDAALAARGLKTVYVDALQTGRGVRILEIAR